MFFLTLKAFHIFFVITWMAGLLYLPRLYVYHASAEDEIGIERFKVMERKLLWGITTPGAVLTVLSGIWLISFYPADALAQFDWLHWKLLLVALLIGYHGWCIKLWLDFKHDRNRHGHVWYRWFNEATVPVLLGILLLVELQPQ
ncbi:MAG: CopD family protein [Pseudomonadota bacterium]